MRTDPETCHPATVSRFYDREFDPETHSRVKAHIDTCPKCLAHLDDLVAISEHLRGPLPEKTIDTMQSALEDNVLSRIQRWQRPLWENMRELLFSRKVLFPATALVSLSLVMFLQLKSPTVSGPSAIITSLSGDTASVIIMETPQTHHTILWFTEDS